MTVRNEEQMGWTSECKDAQRCLLEDEMKKIGILLRLSLQIIFAFIF